MKKVVLGIICLVTLLSAAACGNSTSEASTEESAGNLENVADSSDSQTEIETEDISDSSDSTNESDSEDDIAPEPEVLLDTDEYYVEFQGIEEYSDESWIVDLYVENNTDSDVYLVLSNGLVNGCMIDFSNSFKQMTAGSKYMSTANFDYIIQVSDLQDYNIENIETLEFEASIKESSFGEDIESASARIDMEMSVPTNPDKTEDINGEGIYDADDIYIEYRGIEEYSSESLIVDFYIENNRDSDVWVSLSDETVNGYMISLANSSEDILAGSKYLSVPNFNYIINAEDLETYGIETIDSLSFKVSISTSLFDDTIGEVVFDSEQGVKEEEVADPEDDSTEDTAETTTETTTEVAASSGSGRSGGGRLYGSSSSSSTSSSGSSSTASNSSSRSYSGSSTSHTCAASGCNKTGTYSIVGVSGETEYYCADHYAEMNAMVDSMENSVGTTHTCAVSGCNKTGTRSIIGISGQREYYCAEHYKEMQNMVDGMLGD